MSRFEQQVKNGDQLMPDRVATTLSTEMFSKTTSRANDLDLAKLNNDLHRSGYLPGLNIVGQDSSGHLLIADNNQGSAHKLYQVDQHGKLTASYGVENQGQSKVFRKQEEKTDSSENKNDPYQFNQGGAIQKTEGEPNQDRARRTDAVRPQDQSPPTVPPSEGQNRPQGIKRFDAIERTREREEQKAERRTKAPSIDYYDEVNFHSTKRLLA